MCAKIKCILEGKKYEYGLVVDLIRHAKKIQ
jgi:hypothetical protein